MAKLRYFTKNWAYSKNSLTLLNELLRQTSNRKTIVVFGKDAYFTPPNCERFYVINIYKNSIHYNEYQGFINSYTEV